MSSAAPIVVYTFDQIYAPFAAVSTFSLCQHAQTTPQIYWIVPHADRGPAQAVLRALSNKIPVQINLIAADLDTQSSWRVSHYFTTSVFLRLLIPTLIPHDRCLYLDSDTLVVDALDDLFATDLKGCALAGVNDPLGGKTSRVPRQAQDPYINSGVLVMDLAHLRADQFLQKSELIYRDHEDQITWPDQCLINKYAEGKKHLLDPRWNRLIYSNQTQERHYQDMLKPGASAILHFVGGTKPWQAWCNPAISQIWHSYAQILPQLGPAPTPMTTLAQALELASAFDLNQRYAEASGLKSNIINALLAARASNPTANCSKA